MIGHIRQLPPSKGVQDRTETLTIRKIGKPQSAGCNTAACRASVSLRLIFAAHARNGATTRYTEHGEQVCQALLESI